ncbi:hypothetical protein IE53DRAFT_372982 [Violaceomyces palustris]|uniref:Uncharacterized protein n=1 Tax=Violaceomyces palustris TaxID=1673888 RepID=A0ACD0P693_9BASI|nr:hypothetical protein IE53DRAFT_372982 [Violaceomyces palustris]
MYMGDKPVNSKGYLQANESGDDDDEDEDWNVYDDFNNVRPLSSSAGLSGLQSHDQGYWDATPNKEAPETPYSDYPKRQSLLPQEAFGFDARNTNPRTSFPISMREIDTNANRNSGHLAANEAGSGIELITVPALGAEYTKEEMRQMTRKQKKKNKRSAKKAQVAKWAKGEERACGWLTPRLAVFLAFIFFCLLGVCLFFVIPRVPTFALLTTDPLEAVPDGASMLIHHSPTNFSMDMNLNLRADNGGGWITTKASEIKVQVTDIKTTKKVGEGTLNDFSFPGRKRTVFKMPVSFSYVSLNATGDETFLDFYHACGHKYDNTARPTLNLGISLTMKVKGLIGTKGTSTQISNVACPFELQNFQ